MIFQRLHERTAYAGTGIGLAMTRKIIEYFGGKIWLDTSYTGGTRFCFTLLAPPEITAGELPAPAGAGAPEPARRARRPTRRGDPWLMAAVPR